MINKTPLTVKKFLLKKFPTDQYMDCPIGKHHWETMKEYAEAYHAQFPVPPVAGETYVWVKASRYINTNVHEEVYLKGCRSYKGILRLEIEPNQPEKFVVLYEFDGISYNRVSAWCESHKDLENIFWLSPAIPPTVETEYVLRKFDTDKFYWCKCEDCGWEDSSEFCEGGHAIADSGDYSEVVCPVCCSARIEGEETVKVPEQYDGVHFIKIPISTFIEPYRKAAKKARELEDKIYWDSVAPPTVEVQECLVEHSFIGGKRPKNEGLYIALRAGISWQELYWSGTAWKLYKGREDRKDFTDVVSFLERRTPAPPIENYVTIKDLSKIASEMNWPHDIMDMIEQNIKSIIRTPAPVGQDKKPAVTLKEVEELNVLEDKLIDAIGISGSVDCMNAFLAWQEKRNDLNENRLTLFE